MKGPEAELGATTPRADLWGLWRQLKDLFPTWNFMLSSFYTPGAWGYLGVDFLSGFRRNPSTIKAFALLEGVDEARFDALSALANLNVRRQEQMVRAVIIGYLTVPLSILALLAELAGDSVMTFARANLGTVIPVVVGLTMGPLSYLISHWRSRQIVGVLDLIRIERGQAPYTALELRDE